MAEQLHLPETEGQDAESRQAAVYPKLTRSASLRAAIASFEEYMRQQGFTENTSKAFLSDLGILLQFAGAGTAVGDISTNRLNQFVHWLRNERGVPCSTKSLARRVTTLKVFFGWLLDAGVLAQDPADPVIHKPAISPLPDILSEAQIERVLGVTQALRGGERPDARPHLLVTLLLHTGIKKSECMNIVLNHVDFTDPAQPVLWIRYANPRRRHKERKLSLPSWWPAILAEYRAQYEPESRLFPCTARNLEYVLAGVAEQAELSNGLSFEMLRWTSAVSDYRAGMTPGKLRQKLGISKITWREVGNKIEKLAGPSS
jgi:integrase/recombinase XerD